MIRERRAQSTCVQSSQQQSEPGSGLISNASVSQHGKETTPFPILWLFSLLELRVPKSLPVPCNEPPVYCPFPLSNLRPFCTPAGLDRLFPPHHIQCKSEKRQPTMVPMNHGCPETQPDKIAAERHWKCAPSTARDRRHSARPSHLPHSSSSSVRHSRSIAAPPGSLNLVHC